MSRIRLIIVEDDAEVLKGITAVLQNDPALEVLASYTRAEDILSDKETLGAQVVLMDIGLPGLSGIECVQKLKPRHPGVQFLMWTTFEDDEKIFDALRAGATGYVLKNIPVTELVQAIVDITKGGSPMSNSIARRVIQSFHGRTVKQSEYSLSRRETEILELLAKGYRYKEIAARLFISIETVRKHIYNTYEKLQVQSRTDALNKVFGTR